MYCNFLDNFSHTSRNRQKSIIDSSEWATLQCRKLLFAAFKTVLNKSMSRAFRNELVRK